MRQTFPLGGLRGLSGYSFGALDFNQIRVGGATVRLPPLPSLPQVPQVPLPSASGYQEVVERIGGEALGKAIAAVPGASQVIAQAAALAGPYGPALALGAQAVGSIVSGMFDSEPPEPNVAGLDLDSLVDRPLRSPNDAVLAAKVVAGIVGGVGKNASDQALKNAHEVLFKALSGLAKGDSIKTVDDRLRQIGSGWRACAFFSAYVGYDRTLHDETFGNKELRAQFGKLLAWAAPRVQIREMIWYWYLYRIARAADLLSFGNPNTTITSFRKEFYDQPVPGVGFKAFVTNRDRSGWKGSQRLAGRDREATIGTWAELIASRAMPWPSASDAGIWSYTPIPRDILEAEVEKYDERKLARIQDVPLAGMDRWTVNMPKPSDSGEVTNFPENYAQAATLCFALTAKDTLHMETLAGMLEQRQVAIATANKESKERAAALVKVARKIARGLAKRRALKQEAALRQAARRRQVARRQTTAAVGTTAGKAATAAKWAAAATAAWFLLG